MRAWRGSGAAGGATGCGGRGGGAGAATWADGGTGAGAAALGGGGAGGGTGRAIGCPVTCDLSSARPGWRGDSASSWATSGAASAIRLARAAWVARSKRREASLTFLAARSIWASSSLRSSRDSSELPGRLPGRASPAGAAAAAAAGAGRGTAISWVETWRSWSAIRTRACRNEIASGQRASRSRSSPRRTTASSSGGTGIPSVRPTIGSGGSVNRLKT